MSHPFWPPYDLKISSPRLELRLPTEDEISQMIALAKEGIHDPSFMPFSNDWTDVPSPAFERSFAQHHWGLRANWSPDDWTLSLGVFLDGEPIGNQGVSARNFSKLKSVVSGSWLGMRHQGKGYGKEMRQAMLHFVFDGLGAEAAESEAWADNASSIGVSRSVGYSDNGVAWRLARAERVDSIKFRITKDRWEALTEKPVVEISGLDTCREMFG